MLTSRTKLVSVGLLLVLLLGAQLWATLYFINSDRERYTEQFIEENRHDLQTAVDRVDDRLDDMLSISELLARLVDTDDLQQHERDFRAAVRHQPGLMSAGLWGSDETRRLLVVSESVPDADRSDHVDLLDRAHRRILENGRDVATAGPTDDSEERSLRAFVRPVGGDRPHAAYVGVVVDMRRALDELTPLTDEFETEILVRGPDGEVEPGSTVDIPADWRSGRAPVPGFYRRMSDYRSGSERLDAEMATRLGLPEHERVVHFTSFAIAPEIRWSVGMVTSLLPLRSEQSGVVWRAGLVSVAFDLLLFGFGGWLIFAVRRQRELEERLERKRLISELNAKADAILDAIPVGVIVIDDACRIQDANKEMSAWLGADCDGRHLADAWREATDSSFEALDALLADDPDRGWPRRRLLEDVVIGDERVDLQVEAVSLLETEGTSSVVLAFEDVTTLKEMDEQLLRTEKLATVGILSAGIAHEIGTPLGVIRGRTNYALSTLEDPESVESHLEIVLEQVDDVRDIVRQMLDFSRREEAELQPTDLSETIDSTLQLVEFQTGDGDVELQLDLADDLPKLAANPDKLRQVLINLLLNAVDACHGEGTVRLTARPIADSPIAADGCVEIAVEDTGTGIEEENLHKVFDPFYTTKKRGKGTGLGLAIVDRIVRAHGGHIDVFSIPGERTRFELHWPTHAGDTTPGSDDEPTLIDTSSPGATE